jgi:hypothetical protein
MDSLIHQTGTSELHPHFVKSTIASNSLLHKYWYKEEQERQNARNATRDRPSRQSQPFSVGVNRPRRDEWMTGRVDDGTDG